MADETVEVSAHEHLEPNAFNLLVIAAVVVFVIYGGRWVSNKAPSIFGGLSGI